MTTRPGPPRPSAPLGDAREVLIGYLDHFRSTAITIVLGLPDGDRRRSILPSGWSPLDLLHHLRHMERRWFVWGVCGEPVADPWADSTDGRWAVPPGVTAEQVAEDLREQGRVTAAVVRARALTDPGHPGPRWDGAPPATLERVLLHVLQEYARHVGHLDIVEEFLAGQAEGRSSTSPSR